MILISIQVIQPVSTYMYNRKYDISLLCVGRQELSEHDIRNNYYQVQLEPVHNTPEPVHHTPDPVYSSLDHDIQPNPPHYNVISTAYNTTPQYSTINDKVQYTTIDTVPTPQYSTVDDTVQYSTVDSAVDIGPKPRYSTPVYSTVVVKDGRKVTVTVGGEGSTGDH